jgi:flagellar brake protein
METADAKPLPSTRFELSGAADLDRYMLYSANEIRQILSAVAEHGELVTLYFDGSNDFILTSVLAVGEQAVVLDYGSREDLNRRVLTSAKLVFITSRDKIKVQWISARANRIMHEGKPAFVIAMPRSLLRLQRREYYRLAAPVAKPLRCIVPIEEEIPATEEKAAEVKIRKMEFSVADISLGGVAVHGPLQQAAFEIGKNYGNCEIALPALGNLVATLGVANIFEVTARNGTRSHRAGCRFVGMQGKMLMLLQRYINQIEREKRERMARFA